eukprot:TRINITY_DN2619_c0_g1_i8.p1 TRINITY_DN2619_c0_g1~~TRINITY_DN2619_c0_g1_i8.p1  ORF type:complete len:254 (+),score=26.56 TRINITY_DN2619_c0_g1_i8:28-762(+)
MSDGGFEGVQKKQSCRCCRGDIEGLRKYNRRFKVCQVCHDAPEVDHCGRPMRFCQKCFKFEPLHMFDGTKRSCRAALLKYSIRRREKLKKEVNPQEARVSPIIFKKENKLQNIRSSSPDIVALFHQLSKSLESYNQPKTQIQNQTQGQNSAMILGQNRQNFIQNQQEFVQNQQLFGFQSRKLDYPTASSSSDSEWEQKEQEIQYKLAKLCRKVFDRRVNELPYSLTLELAMAIRSNLVKPEIFK